MSYDSHGVYGEAFVLAGLTLLVLGALFAFLFFLFKGRLDFDEAPKMKMMESEDE